MLVCAHCFFLYLFFFFKQKTAYEMQRGLVGSEMCIRDRSHMLQFSFEQSKKLFVLNGIYIWTPNVHKVVSVSYTHLTLPTILLVQISVVAVSLKKKTNKERHPEHIITL
eukprot:TRINITY_DN4076_c0_g1_i2.p2 TRINITY_DN4076_c0_g1~~TRINITY_DN4076_c0_g1_i2.p2  ORF type:complete len:110 (+),score=36.57 TRINITY_DN4076_c0_g1_i2:18-347(+)